MQRSKLAQAIKIGSAVMAASMAVPALSEDLESERAVQAVASPQSDDQRITEEVTVTGSYIGGTPEDAALPVTVIDAEELKLRGSPTVLDIIKSMTMSGPVMGDTNQFPAANQGRIGGGSINLRGLGPERTLVLLNGRRFQYGQVDTNMLPLAAIGRVEVLKDGAAATYGSDAIGGVANFVTRTDLDGFDVSADYRAVDGSDGDTTFSAAYGWSGEKGNVLISAGYQQRSELSMLERDWSFQPRDINPTSYSTLGNPGIILPLTSSFTPSGPGLTRDANCGALGGEDGYFAIYPVCYFPFGSALNLVEEEERYQVYAEANYNFSDTTRFHFETLYSSNDTPALRSSPSYPPLQGPFGPGSVGVFSTPISNPGAVTALEQAGYTPQQIADTSLVGLTFWRPFALSGNPNDGGAGGAASQREYELLRISAGLDGDIGDDFHWQFSTTYVQDNAFARTPDILINRLQSALNGFGGPNCSGTTPGANGCEYFNPFSNAVAANPATGAENPGYVSANANSNALNAWLFDDVLQESQSDYWVVDAVVSGATGFELSGGEVEYAVGGQYRGLDYAYDPLNDSSNALITPCPTPGQTNCAFPTGPFIFQGQTVPSRLDENVYAAFAELSLPLTDDINVQAAIRFEDYGGQTGSTTNPKISAKWQANDWLALRGSAGTTFRGPTPGNRANSGRTGLTGIAAAGNAFKSVDQFGNPAVGPEQAFTYNVGALFSTDSMTASIDYWTYELEDQILSVPANIIATGVAGVGSGTQFVDCSHSLRDLITFANNNTCEQGVTVANDIQRVRSDVTNGPTVNTSGIDASVNYRFDGIAGGALELSSTLSYILEYDQSDFVYAGVTVSEAYDAAGFANYDRFPGSIPELRAMTYAQYEHGDHILRATYSYIDGVTDNRGPTVTQTGVNPMGCSVATATADGCTLIDFGQPVEAFKTLDLNYTLQLQPWDTTLSFAVMNALDTNPPEARLELSYDPSIASPYGRTFKFAVRKQF
ncbi:TonB-dependent receptor plug domain-containing protein [Microbulbifer pacificus]|uniref:TonB-dependent receptor n=1 Tax=Microbulbifer pacificus TaxID=407164 RepID=A0AAU0N635_9GAMM|nr:TonB-dependent receptor [Microbulbifer pacificus]WOX07041.1 TonB-dependent receptor [Microbulbifer pacificus]